MNITQLNHHKTPPELAEINDQLAAVLNAQELDDGRLLLLVIQRDDFIQAHLQCLNPHQERDFAKAEHEVNKQLTALLQRLFHDNTVSLSKLIRGRKAINKYT